MDLLLPPVLPLTLTDSIGNSLPLSAATLNYLAAALSSLILFLLLTVGGSRQRRPEERIDEGKIRILEGAAAAAMVRLKPPFLLPSPAFRWPEQAAVVEEVAAAREGAVHLSTQLTDRLQELGILRRGEDRRQGDLATAAMARGSQLPRRSIRVSFDTFQAKARPGLETSSEDEEKLKSSANTMTMIMLGRTRRGSRAAMATNSRTA